MLSSWSLDGSAAAGYLYIRIHTLASLAEPATCWLGHLLLMSHPDSDSGPAFHWPMLTAWVSDIFRLWATPIGILGHFCPNLQEQGDAWFFSPQVAVHVE